MFTLVLLCVQTVFVLGSAAAGAYLSGGLRTHRKPPVTAPQPPPGPGLAAFLPEPSQATVSDLKQGMAMLAPAIARLESGSATEREYTDARDLAQWTLDAGRIQEERLARRLEREDRAPGHMDRETALETVRQCHAEGVPQRAVARITGWSRGWVADQYKLLGGS